jgi:hypothetical protein
MMARDDQLLRVTDSLIRGQQRALDEFKEQKEIRKKVLYNLVYAPADNMRFSCMALGAVEGGLFAQSAALKAVTIASVGVTIPAWMLGALIGCMVACLLLAVLNYCNRLPPLLNAAEAIAERRGQSV